MDFKEYVIAIWVFSYFSSSLVHLSYIGYIFSRELNLGKKDIVDFSTLVSAEVKSLSDFIFFVVFEDTGVWDRVLLGSRTYDVVVVQGLRSVVCLFVEILLQVFEQIEAIKVQDQPVAHFTVGKDLYQLLRINADTGCTRCLFENWRKLIKAVVKLTDLVASLVSTVRNATVLKDAIIDPVGQSFLCCSLIGQTGMSLSVSVEHLLLKLVDHVRLIVFGIVRVWYYFLGFFFDLAVHAIKVNYGYVAAN